MKNFTYIIAVTLLFLVFPSISFSQDLPSMQTKTLVSNADVLIYPNPVTDDNFSVKSDNIIKTVEVLNVIGQCVKKITNDTGVAYNIIVKMPDCDKGMYMVRITFVDDKSLIKKILFK
jgi:hypothetical protein